jgi:hypothetical protein
MMGLLKGIARLTKSGSLLLRRRAILCDLTLKRVEVGMDWFESAVISNLKGADTLGIFLEACGCITKKLCSLLLGAWWKEIEVN